MITELRPHLHRLQLGRYQAYLWHDEHSTTLVDTGEPGSGPQIAAALATLGVAPSDLDQLVLTHCHDDHAGSAAEVTSWGDVEVVAHAADAAVLRGDEVAAPPCLTPDERALHAVVAAGLQPAAPVRVDREVRDGDVLDLAGGALVIATPGHTPGSIAVYLPQADALLTGDIAAEHGGDVMFGVFHQDRALAARSLHRLLDVDAQVACFGHGEPVLTDARARLADAAERSVSQAVPTVP